MSVKYQYFEDYEVGKQGATDSRTVTVADIANFAYIAEDYNKPHLDRYAMSSSIYGDIVAHGLLGSSLVTGMLSYHYPYLIGRGVPGAYLYKVEFNYRQGLKLGQTVSIHWRISEKNVSTEHAGFGLVSTAYQIVTQAGIPVYDGTLSTLVRTKKTAKATLDLKPVAAVRDFTDFAPEEGKTYFAEDYVVGKGGDTDGRTITEADIVNFAGLTGDFNPQHVDARFAAEGMFGERTAHSMLAFSTAYGLWLHKWHLYRMPESKKAAAGHLGDKATFLYPVKIGDTIFCRWKVLNNRISKSNPDIGIVTFGLQIINQRDEVVIDGSTTMMVGAKSIMNE